MDAVFPVGVLVMLTFCSELSVMTPSRSIMKSATVSFLLILLLNVSGCFSQQCHHTEYWSGTYCCPKCPAGKRVKTDCSLHRSTSCTGCEGGTFMDQTNGLQHCFPCRSCGTDSGLTVKTACTTTSNCVCEPVEGFYCVDVSQGSCAAAKQHSSCQPGQYISKKGSWHEDTECSACPDGTFSTGSSSSCQPHTQCLALNPVLIKAGSSSADAECGPGSDHTGVIVGVTVSLIAVLAAIAGGLVFLRSKKRKENGQPDPERRPLPEGTDVLQLHCGEPEQLLQLKTAAPQSFIYKVLNGFQRRLKTFCSIKSRNKHDFFFQVHWCYTAIYRLEDCQKTSVTLKRLMSNIPSILKTS